MFWFSDSTASGARPYSPPRETSGGLKLLRSNENDSYTAPWYFHFVNRLKFIFRARFSGRSPEELS